MEKSQEFSGKKSSSDPYEIFYCPECESELEAPGHNGEAVVCNTCGKPMQSRSREPEGDFFVCPECNSELEAPGHKGEPIVCPTCGGKYSEEEAKRPS